MSNGFLPINRHEFDRLLAGENMGACRTVLKELAYWAFWEPGYYDGHKMERGMVVMSLSRVISNTGLTRQKIRNAYKKLELNKLITRVGVNKYSIITILCYDQVFTLNNQATNEQQTSNKRATPDKEIKNKRIKESTKVLPPEAALFNEILGTKLPKVQRISPKRASKLKKAKQFLPTLQDWSEYFTAALDSPFLLGDNKRGWRADFDWLLEENNYTKVVEDKYLDAHTREQKKNQANLLAELGVLDSKDD